RALTGGLDAPPPVAMGEAEQLLDLAEPRPRERAGEQPRDEGADRGPLGVGVAGHALRVTERVRGEMRRIVADIGVAPAGGLAGMRLEQDAVLVDADERAIAAYPQAVADHGGGDGVQRPLKFDVVIGVRLAALPGRRIEARARDRLQRRLLDRLEDGERPLLGRPVDAHPGDRATPPHDLALDMREVEPGLAAEEILAHVLNAALDVRLPGRVARDGRVDHEAAYLRVLGEDAL